MKKRGNNQALILTSTVVAALVAGATVENSKANAENPRVSVAAGNILSNTNATSISGEIVGPPSNVLISEGTLSMTRSVANGSGYGLAINGDPSQIVLKGRNDGPIRIRGNFQVYSSEALTNTVEAAIASSINNAVTANRYGDIIGIVNAYNPPKNQNIENASVAMALTNILSNTNSQNIAGEIVALPNRYYLGLDFEDDGGGVSFHYGNATQFGSPDSSQMLVDRVQFNTIFSGPNNEGLFVSTGDFTNHTVEGAITNAISTATNLGRYGDVIGITNVYKGPGTQNPANARYSIAITNVLSNTNSLSIAGEAIAPEDYFVNRAQVRGGYTNASSVTGFSDPSQLVVRTVLINTTNINGMGPVSSVRPSVNSTIANAINQANGLSRYGDVIGIVNAYKGPWQTQYQNPRASLALTNILSNTNSQNFAAEFVAPENDYYLLGLRIGFDAGNTDTVQYLVPGGDISQLAISQATVSARLSINAGDNAALMMTRSSQFVSNTVEGATASAMRNAETQGRIGDVIGITRAWQSGGRASLD